MKSSRLYEGRYADDDCADDDGPLTAFERFPMACGCPLVAADRPLLASDCAQVRRERAEREEAVEAATLRAHLVGRAQGADALARSEVTSLVAAARRNGRASAGLGGGGWVASLSPAVPTTAPERLAPLGAAGSCSTSPAGSLATSISTTGDRGAADAAWERFYTHGGDTFLQSALMTSTASKNAQQLIWS